MPAGPLQAAIREGDPTVSAASGRSGGWASWIRAKKPRSGAAPLALPGQPDMSGAARR